MEEAVRRWRAKGQIFFWFEADKRQGDGWHIAADKAGCNDLEAMLDLAERSPFPSRFNIAPAEAERTVGAPKQLQFAYNKDWSPDHWHLVNEAEAVTIQFGPEYLKVWREVVSDLRRGHGDYTMGADEGLIWVWWPPR